MEETKPENQTQNDTTTTTKTTTNHHQQKNKKRKKNECAIFGNYRYYYSYRIDEGLDEDPRINALRKEWFEGKDCLDIGCNSGVITVNIAEKFGCRSMLGIDIDSARVDDAYWNLRRVISRKSHKKDATSHKTKAAGLLGGKESVPTTSSSTEKSKDLVDASSPDLSKIVTFRKGNIVEDKCLPEKTLYDTIICFSVTKWIHLNWGDDGLVAMFAKIWKVLKPGGVCVLEPQPWKSYNKKHVISQVARTNYQKLEIFPKDFQEILLDKIGFRMIENLSSNLSGSKSGFKRPILALWK